MKNQPLNSLEVPTSSPWIDLQAPIIRLQLLAVLMSLPLLAIGARMVQVQTVLADDLLSSWDELSVTYEAIPARDGRILSVDGVILADVRPRFDLLVQYRWVEEPANPQWLRREALSRLPREARRDATARAAAVQQVEAERELLWRQLATLLNVSEATLRDRRQRLQRRIERMRTDVERRRALRRAENEIRPLDLSEGLQGVWDRLVHELTTSPERYEDAIVLREELQPHAMATDISQQVAGVIDSMPSRFRGVSVHVGDVRMYPEGDLAGHVLGLRKPAAENAEGGLPSVGVSGLERAYDRLLRSRYGARQLTRNRQGEVLDEATVQPPEDGRDLQLTLHAQLQKRAEQLLDRAMAGTSVPLSDDPGDGDVPDAPPQGGVVLVMDIRTGDLLTAAMAPRVSQSLLQRPTIEEWQRVQDDPLRPLFNRITQAAVPPGSVFKLLTSIALLESQTISPTETKFCKGYVDEPDRHRCYIYRRYGTGHGDLMLADALCQSCNVFFFEAARDMGAAQLTQWAARCGFGQPTGIDLPGEAAGNLPNPARMKPGEHWYPGTTMQLAIGQGALTVTPLQVLRFVAAIANDGALVSPRLVRLTDVNESGLPAAGTIQRIQGLHPQTLAAVREGMQLAVSHPKGTGRAAWLAEIPMAAKTGTAEVGSQRPDHAWFAGYLPVDQPRFAFVVLLEHGGSGGRTAAPLMRELAIEMDQLGLLPEATE